MYQVKERNAMSRLSCKRRNAEVTVVLETNRIVTKYAARRSSGGSLRAVSSTAITNDDSSQLVAVCHSLQACAPARTASVVRGTVYRMEIDCVSCEVRTEFIYVM
jgi:hypothetical protein